MVILSPLLDGDPLNQRYARHTFVRTHEARERETGETFVRIETNEGGSYSLFDPEDFYIDIFEAARLR